VERQILGVDHQALGQGLAQQWRFTRICQLVAGFHHHPSELEEECPQAWAVHIADTLCCQTGPGFNLTARGTEFDPMALSKLGINGSVIDQIRDSMSASIGSAMGVFA
jgi:HD-like signal output (HDOD) protein